MATIIVYGPVLRRHKHAFWEELTLLGANSQPLWIVCGDFNSIRTPQEKYDSNFDIGISRFFNDFVQDHLLIEHKLFSRKFTWTNGRQSALLDRIFTSLDCDLSYPDSSISDLSSHLSDHCPLILQTHGHTTSIPKTFKFDPLWLEQEDFLQLLPKWWQESPLKLPDIAHSWNCKLKHVRKGLGVGQRIFMGLEEKKNNNSFLFCMTLN